MAGASRTLLSPAYRISIAVILLCGTLAAVALFREARREEDRHAEAEFAGRSTLRHAFAREVLGRYVESLFGLSTLLAVDTDVTRSDFDHAAAQLRQRLPGALAFEWAPIVPSAERSDRETMLRHLYGRRTFEFIEFNASGHPRRAANRPFHYPICYIYPMQRNEVALGYDLTAGPTLSFLERARETRRLVVTSRFRLVQQTQDQRGLVMICPVFRSDFPNGTDPFLGFVQCVFQVDELLETACASEAGPTLDVLFVDASETDGANRVLYYRPGPDNASRQPMPAEDEFRRGALFTRELGFPVGGRDWRMIFRPRSEWLESQRSLAPWIRSTTIMLLSVVLAGLVSVIGRRTEIIRREVEERTAELAESRRQFANLLHALPGMAYRAMYTGELEIVFASEGALALTGWAAGDFVSGTVRFRDLVHPDDAQRLREVTHAALTERKDYELEYRIRTRAGDDKWVLSRGRGVYDSQGELQSVEGLVIDISEGKRAEAARLAIERKLLETQKLESLGLLAGGIAHDFNNLLSTILGNANLARMSLDTDSAVDPQLRAIETAALRAAELCRQMLAYAGKGRFVVERVELSALIEDLLPLLRVSIPRSATLHLDLKPELPGFKADATQIRQIVMNLVLNAVDALAGRKGEITIRTALASVDKSLLSRCAIGTGLPLGEYVSLEVSDTGCGMPPEVRSKIFDPFFTTKFAGRGLGLAAVLGIVRGHNGALLVESQVNQGSTFRLFLPPLGSEANRPEGASPPKEEPWRQTGDVLIIEDEVPVREIMGQLLATFGFTVSGAAGGQEGVAMFHENASRWALVVIDLLMPGMSGEETLDALRAIKPDVRVLLISGYAEDDVLARIGGGPQVAFLSKPFKRETFEATLRQLFAAPPGTN